MGGEWQQLYTQVARPVSHCHGLSMIQEFGGFLEAVSNDEALIFFVLIRHLVTSELHANRVTLFVVVYIQYLRVLSSPIILCSPQ